MTPNGYREPKWMQLPRFIVTGHGTINEVTNVCRKLNYGDNGLVITGKYTKKIAGDIVRDAMDDDGYNVDLEITSGSSMDEVKRIKALASKNDTRYMLGVGGGATIDIAKLASTELGLPFISVPTAASHDGIVSSRASIMHDGKTTSLEADAPMAVVADTEIIADAPYHLLAAGCGDIISNYTAVLDWELAHRLKNESFSEYAAALSRMTAKILVDSAELIKPDLESSARIVVKALVSSGVAMSIAGSTRPASGSEHMFSHALNQVAPVPALHGEQCGVGAIMMMYLHGGDWERIRDALKTIHAPTNADELGIEDKYILEALVLAHTIRPERYTIIGTGLSHDAAENIARITKVIT